MPTERQIDGWTDKETDKYEGRFNAGSALKIFMVLLEDLKAQTVIRQVRFLSPRFRMKQDDSTLFFTLYTYMKTKRAK